MTFSILYIDWMYYRVEIQWIVEDVSYFRFNLLRSHNILLRYDRAIDS